MGDQLLLFEPPPARTAAPRAPPRGGEPGRLFAGWRDAVLVPCRLGWVVLGPRTAEEAIRATRAQPGLVKVIELNPRAWRVEVRGQK